MSTTVSTKSITDTDVLIVGAGPTGLALAIMLIRFGIKPIIVDKLIASQNTSRAAVIHAHTLEVLEKLKVAEQLVQKGLKLAKFSIRDRDQILVRLHFDDLPTQHPYLLMLPQDMTEKILSEKLVEIGGTVRRGCKVEALVNTSEGVEASMISSEGKQTIHARYVVGADGMHSMVRMTAGIGFAGASYEESFILADVDMTWSHGREEVMLFFSPAGLVVVAPLPSGSYRIVATMENAPEHPEIADVQALLDDRGPTRGDAKISRVYWSSSFHLHHRVADHYRSGCFLLIGDAAHVHSPAGGQGMNTGLVDACVLGQILADVILGRKAESHLDRYEALRRPAAKQVLALAGRLTQMATMKGVPQQFFRNIILRMVGLLPMTRRKLEMDLSGLSRRIAAELHDN